MAQDSSVPEIVVNPQQQNIDITFSDISPDVPKFAQSPTDQVITDIVAESTQAQIADQGYTYNQSGFTYNQAGWMYGGIYNQNQDVAPVFADNTAYLINPSISGIVDIYSPFVPPAANHGMLIGMLGLTYP